MDGILAIMRRENLAGENAFKEAKAIYEKETAGTNGKVRSP